METNKTAKFNLPTIFLILAIIVIIIMAIFMYKFYNEKKEANKKSVNFQSQATNLNETINALQEKIDSISNTVSSDNSIENNSVESTSSQNNSTKDISSQNSKVNTSNSVPTLDKKYNNSKYGITFSYPSSLSNHQNSLTNDMVESFSDNKGNNLTIVRFSDGTLEKEIENVKNLKLPNGKKYLTNIKKEGYVTLDSGTNGYVIETTDNTIRLLVEKNNIVFTFTIEYTSGNENLSNSILNSFSIK